MRRVGAFVEWTHGGTMAAVVALVVVDPSGGLRSAPDWAGWISGQQRLDRVMSRVAPVLFISTGVSAAGAAVVAAQRHATTVAIWRGLAAAFVAAAVGVTLKVNEPLNERLRGWRAEACNRRTGAPYAAAGRRGTVPAARCWPSPPGLQCSAALAPRSFSRARGGGDEA